MSAPNAGGLRARFAQTVAVARDVADDRGDLRERNDEAVADRSGHEGDFCPRAAEVQCAIVVGKRRKSQSLTEGGTEYYFFRHRYYGGRIGDQCHGERASHFAESRPGGRGIRPGDRVNVRVRPEGGVIIEAEAAVKSAAGLHEPAGGHEPAPTDPQIVDGRDHADDPGRGLTFIDTNILIDIATANPVGRTGRATPSSPPTRAAPCDQCDRLCRVCDRV